VLSFQRRAISHGIRQENRPPFFLNSSFRGLDGKLIDRPMTHRDLAQLHVGDTSRDLMDSTVILSYERTNYVIKDKINDICTRARSHVCTLHRSQVRLTEFSCLKRQETFIRGHTSRRYVKDWRMIAVQEMRHVTTLWIYLQRNQVYESNK